MQWHPVFAHLLRAQLQGYYDVLTEVPVGDLPREADLLVLRRTNAAPFQGIWRHLRSWNVLEFKGPTDNPGLRDLDLLIEVGLGIDRRLNEERQTEGKRLRDRHETTWWLLANHIGLRFRAEVGRVLGQALKALEPGSWCFPALGRTLVLVSRNDLVVDRDSVPLHLVSRIRTRQERELAACVSGERKLLVAYGNWLGILHPSIWREVQTMIRDITKVEELDLRPLIEVVGLKTVIDQVGLKQVIDQVGLKQVIDEIGAARLVEEFHWLAARLTPEQREELKRQLG
jgi:hypothetical protein